jgi:hypothetical protein
VIDVFDANVDDSVSLGFNPGLATPVVVPLTIVIMVGAIDLYY